MSLFVIADLHLSSDGSKSMEIFGPRWTDYMNKLRRNWTAVVEPEDTVIVPGDISWGLKLEDAIDDLKFLDSLPGKKLIGKGNHDFWWSTAAKMKVMMEEQGIKTIKLLYNNAYICEDCIVCGTRGWFVEENQQHTVGNADYNRIVNREVIRLRLSLDEAMKLKALYPEKEVLAFLHFPAVWAGKSSEEILSVLKEYGIRRCFYGHVHGPYDAAGDFEAEGIRFSVTSADFLHFTPKIIHSDMIL
jgi:predicted phosphohydrolase